jgi:signal transduction histidine kinase
MAGSSKSATRFWPLAAFILLPVLVLAVVAAYGLRDRRAAVLAEASRQCRAGEIVSEWGSELDRVLKEAPVVILYDDPPVPRPPGPEAEKLDAAVAAGDVVLLRDLMLAKGPPAFTASGLPVNVLAGWKLVDLAGDPADREFLGRLVTKDTPSAVSGEIIRRLSAKFPGEAEEYQWLARGRRLEARQAALREVQPELSIPGLRHRMVTIPDASPEVIGEVNDTHYSPKVPLSPDRSGPRAISGSPALIRISEGHDARVLLEGELRETLQRFRERMRRQLPAWAVINVSAGGIQLGDAGLDVVFGFGDKYDCRVDVGTHSVEPILEDYYRMVAWARAIIGTASVSSALGLFFMRRTLAKERRLGEMKSQFVSSVSHELRAPIGSMRLMAEGLAAGKVTGSAAQEFHRLMAGEGARLSSLIENVLDFARIEQGRKQYHFTDTDITALVQDAVKLMTPQAEARGLKLLIDLAPLPFVPCVDAGALQQALINLLDNAIKFTADTIPHPPVECGPDTTAIVVHLATDPSRNVWSLSVTDHGCGIPRAEHDRIFERFYRLGNELRRETTGTGIGLAIVKHIVEAHAGRVIVESEPGKGSTFRMEFSVLRTTSENAP